MIRRMKPSNNGTVKTVSPWLGLQTIPFLIRWLLIGATDWTSRPSTLAISPDR